MIILIIRCPVEAGESAREEHWTESQGSAEEGDSLCQDRAGSKLASTSTQTSTPGSPQTCRQTHLCLDDVHVKQTAKLCSVFSACTLYFRPLARPCVVTQLVSFATDDDSFLLAVAAVYMKTELTLWSDPKFRACSACTVLISFGTASTATLAQSPTS